MPATMKSLLLICLLIASGAGMAQAYPVKSVRIINPYVPGGSTDLVLRTLATKLTESWGQAVIVENRPGGGTNLGTEVVVRAAPDGYTLLNATSSLAINASLYAHLPFDARTDLAPVILLTQSFNVIAVHPSVRAQSLKELLELARARPGALSYGSSGNGATNHLAMELMKSMAGVDLVHVPYKGGGQALNDLIGGQIQLMFNPPSSIMPHAARGRVRALAITSAKRIDGIDLPTMAEAGLPGFESSVWFGLFVPAATPVPVIRKLNAEIDRILRMADVAERFCAAGLTPVGGSPEKLDAYFREDLARWARVVKASGAKPDQ